MTKTAALIRQDVESLPDRAKVVDQFPFLDLNLQFASIREEILAAAIKVIETQQFILGPEVQAFEAEIARLLDVRSAVGCGSGSDALYLSLLALGVGHGHEVITTPFTFFATAGAITRTGATPVFVDICAETFNIDPSLIAARVTGRTRVIIPVHLFGLPADMDPLLSLANDAGLIVIEDAAQAIGARYRDKFIGGLGKCGCLSFFPSKNLGGAGDGGMVTTNDMDLADRIRVLRVHGSRKKYHHDMLGTNSRLDAIQAAILRVKLRHLEEWTRRRREKAGIYRQLFLEHQLNTLITLPSEPDGCDHAFNQFVIQCPRRDALRSFLRNAGIPTEVYYPLPLHLQPAFSYLGYAAGQLPVSEMVSERVLALSIYPEISAERQIAVVRAIAAFYHSTSSLHMGESQ